MADEGLIIGTRKHGENAVIIEAMTTHHGRHMGLVRGGRSRRYAALLQPGNTVELNWRARLEDHLGAYTVEAKKTSALRNLCKAEIGCRSASSFANIFAFCQSVIRTQGCWPKQMPCTTITLTDMLGCALAKFEMRLLNELGFGIDIGSCALTGEEEGLAYISPKTGRAVTAEAAKPYLDKLMRLPHIFGGALDMSEKDEVQAAFRLTEHFLNMHIWLPRQLSPPSARERLIKSICNGL